MIELRLTLKLTLTVTATATLTSLLTFTATTRAKVCVCSGQHSDGCLSPGLLLWLRRRCPSLAPALESLCNVVVVSLLQLLLLLQSSGRKVFVQATSDVLTLTAQSELFPQNYRIILSRLRGSTKWTAQFQNVKNELRIWGWTVIEERPAFKVVMSFWCCWPTSSATADKKGTKSGKGSEIIAMLSFFSSPDLRRTKNKRKLEEQVTAIIIWSKYARNNTNGSVSFSSQCSNETNLPWLDSLRKLFPGPGIVKTGIKGEKGKPCLCICVCIVHCTYVRLESGRRRRRSSDNLVFVIVLKVLQKRSPCSPHHLCIQSASPFSKHLLLIFLKCVISMGIARKGEGVYSCTL